MPRHTPTLFPHAEHDDDAEDGDWMPSYSSPPPLVPNAAQPNGRSRPRTKKAMSHPSSLQSSSNTYSQFVKRYRSSEYGDSDDPRDDPDRHYFNIGLGELQDAGDSDDDELPRGALASTDTLAAFIDADPRQPHSEKDIERLSWKAQLASVLSGDVLKSERARIAVVLENSGDEKNVMVLNFWYGIRAKFHGVSEEEERKNLDDRRLRLVDPVIDEIIHFRVNSPDENDTATALQQVTAVLQRLEVAQALYPSLKQLYHDKPRALESSFQARRDALNTWSTVILTLQHQITVLRRWTGSETLDVAQPNTSNEVPITTISGRMDGHSEIADGASFVERVLKEESVQRMFEKGSLVTNHAFIGAARDAQVNLGSLFKEMGLPTFEKQLSPLIAFPTKLAQAALRVRLGYVQKIQDPDVLIVDQMTEDLKISIGLACALKRQYESFLAPDPEGKWNVPQCIDEDYDATILDATKDFFQLIHWKLKSGTKGIYFKETDFLEAQWATMNDIAMTISGGSYLVAEQLCSLANRLMIRVISYFDTQLRVPSDDDVKEQNHSYRPLRPDRTPPVGNGIKDAIQSLDLDISQPSAILKKMSDSKKATWYGKILESVRLRYRKLQRFARTLTQRFANSAEYSLQDTRLDFLMDCLAATDHFLVYTRSYEEDGHYVVASSSLFDRPDLIPRLLSEAFHVEEFASQDTFHIVDQLEDAERETLDYEESQYLLVLSPMSQFTWRGRVMLLELTKTEMGMEDNRVRLISDGAGHRLALAKQTFLDSFALEEEDGVPVEPEAQMVSIKCLTEQQAHLPAVNRELRKISKATMKLAESIVDSVHRVHSSMNMSDGCQELMENWYAFASEHGQHSLKYMEPQALARFNQQLIKLAISWVTFICDDCDPSDRRTFKWAVNALEYTFQRINRNILNLPEDEFVQLRHKVGICINLLMGHFDILGARTSLEARKEKERQEEQLRLQGADATVNDEDLLSYADPCSGPSSRKFWEKVSRCIQEVEEVRNQIGTEYRVLGRVLDNEKLEDRSLVFLASASSNNFSIRWQQGKFIGAGAFGSVYSAVNLESGALMAVKEIKFTELAGSPAVIKQITDELRVMEMLHHPNIVEYYGIEVHRDKVYIFEEYCQGGSLASFLEHGTVEDEGLIQVYTLQMLEGLHYLHSQGVVHRDVKPDNILLHHSGILKFVDFGAAKILARNQRTRMSRRGPDLSSQGGTLDALGGINPMAVGNSLTGTPMYMSPEVIKNDKRGQFGAMDIWAMGCVVLELATGKKPWRNLDNEWAIMFHIGIATQHPPLPEPGQLSEPGISFIKQCLMIDPMIRPTALELMSHPWMLEFRETLASYEEAEIAKGVATEFPAEEFKNATAARTLAQDHMHEIELIKSDSPTTLPSDLPTSPETTPPSPLTP